MISLSWCQANYCKHKIRFSWIAGSVWGRFEASLRSVVPNPSVTSCHFAPHPEVCLSLIAVRLRGAASLPLQLWVSQEPVSAVELAGGVGAARTQTAQEQLLHSRPNWFPPRLFKLMPPSFISDKTETNWSLKSASSSSGWKCEKCNLVIGSDNRMES